MAQSEERRVETAESQDTGCGMREAAARPVGVRSGTAGFMPLDTSIVVFYFFPDTAS